jgi:hypothetical protein
MHDLKIKCHRSIFKDIGLKALLAWIPAYAGMTAYLIFASLFFVNNSHALSSISITADKITYENAILHKANITLDLTGADVAVVRAETLEYGKAHLDNPHISVDLKANTTMLIKTNHILMNKIEAQNSTIYLDYAKKTEQPTVTFYSDIKQITDNVWSAIKINCLIPKKAKVEVWECPGGLFTAERTRVPFSITITPQPNGIDTEINLTDANFSDESGLHAGDKLTGKIKVSAELQKDSAKKDIWHWKGLFSWTEGELFWQPFYFGKAGNEFNISGTYSEPMLNIQQANLKINEVGNMSASAEVNIKTQEVKDANVVAKNVDFAGLYKLVLQPMAEKSAFGNLKVSGKADWKFDVKGLQPVRFELNLKDANIEDLDGKFALSDINAHIPWDYDASKTVTLAYSKGHVLNIPLGNTRLQAELNRYSVTAPSLVFPVLDGALKFEDVSAAYLSQQWVWHVKMQLQPISMNTFSKTLGWPEMQGKIDGQVPLITYAGKQLSMDGKMQFNMFNGNVTMDGLRIDDPLGTTPKLYANLQMRNIDLGDLTRTFNFGAIEGKLEGDVKDLRLENWKPVRMDAKIETADGKHLKKISQRAVENITALGGEGTAAALQRTFLRFFKEFNYEKIGLSCQLRQDVCKMSGVESTRPESTTKGYIIVKGRGVPSVNVNGFTEYVSLSDLIERMTRITDSNSKMIVK